jgi:phage terminase large subunit
MSVTIKPIIDHENYMVNEKEVYKDSKGNWISKTELSQQELTAFQNYKKAVIENKAFKTHTTATYHK